MRRFSREFQHNYANYQFGYCNFCELEAIDELDQAYAEGYLPASGKPFPETQLFYQARSLQVDLAEMQFNKGRRYLQRQGDAKEPRVEMFSKEEFLKNPQMVAHLRTEAMDWVRARFPESYMPQDRLDFILQRPFLNRILKVSVNAEPQAYAMLVAGEKCIHYWFAFFRPSADPKASPGKWLMGRFLEWARDEGYAKAYLGTAYALKSSYKYQGISHGCSFFDGSGWNPDVEELARRQAAEDTGN